MHHNFNNSQTTFFNRINPILQPQSNMLTDKENSFIESNPSISSREEKRVQVLKSYDILNSQSIKELDNITELAAMICETPLCAVSILDDNKQWFKSKKGFNLESTDKAISFCQYAIKANSFFEINDTLKDEYFRKNPFVIEEPKIRFYAGQPLIDPDGYALGTLCVMDYKPGKLSAKQQHMLSRMAAEVVSQIVSRKELAEKKHFEEIFIRSIDLVCLIGNDGYFKLINPAFSVVLGWTIKELMSKPFLEFVHPDDRDQTSIEFAKQTKGIRVVNFSNRYLTKSGGHKILCWVSNPDSSKGLIYAVARDQSEKIEPEVQLIIAAKKFRALFENSPDAIFVEDTAGNILDVNIAAAAIQGIPKEELIGKNIRQLIPKEKYVKLLSEYKKLFHGSIKTVESFLWSRTKGAIPIEITCKRFDFGEQPALLLMVRDISERIKNEDECINNMHEKIVLREEQVKASIKIQEEERNRIAMEMHDEIGADLSRISILGQLINKSSQNDSIKQQIDKILIASANVQENINSIIWAMDPKNDTLENLVAYINYYTSEYLETSEIELKISLPEKIPVLNVKSKTRRYIYLLIKESINNLVKYSEATKVNINILTTPDLFSIMISDNGVGFNTDEIPRFGNGIKNMKGRAAAIGGEFVISSKKLSGTTMLLNVPLV